MPRLFPARPAGRMPVSIASTFSASLAALLVALLVLLPLGVARPAEAAPDPAECATVSPVQVLVRVHDVRSADGTVTVVVYGDKPADFLARGKRLERRRVPARQGTVSLCLALPRVGTYALALYHDEDGDRHLTRNLVGMPTEGYGFSRDAPTTFGLPSFNDAAFSAGPGNTILEIKMRY